MTSAIQKRDLKEMGCNSDNMEVVHAALLLLGFGTVKPTQLHTFSHIRLRNSRYPRSDIQFIEIHCQMKTE